MDIHDLKQQLQSHLSDGLVTIVGSGLSCAEGMPGMGELGKHLRATVGAYIPDTHKTEWDQISALLDTHGLEAALIKHPPTPVIESAIIKETGALMAQREREIITEVFNGSRHLRFTRIMTHMLKPNTGIPIVTTNYDRLIEVAVEESGHGVDTLFIGHFAGGLNPKESQLSFCRDIVLKKRIGSLVYRNRAIVLKPHGSLNWYLRNGTPVRYDGELPDSTRLMITPGHNKFRNGYDSPFDTHRERANRTIDLASRFLILGYGFNDDHLETHLMLAIKAGKPTLIITYQLSDVAYRLALNYSNVTTIDHGIDGAKVGTRVIHNKISQFVPDMALWDLNEYVTEVHEP